MNSENSILPDTWTKVSLEEINFKRSETIDPSKEPYASFELYSVPSFDYRQPEEIYGKEIGSTKQIVNVDDVLICKINPRINRVWRVSNSENSKKIASSEWIVINSKGFINSDYLRYAFSAPFFRLKLNSEVSGVGGSLTRARPKLVKDYKIPLAPLNEQNRIVEKLDALFARIDSIKERMETIPELIRQFRQSVLHAAVTGELTEEWRKANEIRWSQEIEHGKENKIGWKTQIAEDACLKVQNGTTPTNNPFTIEGDIPFLKVYNIQDQKIAFDYKPQFVKREVHESVLKRSIAFPYDVIINIVGPPLGKVALITCDYPEWNLNQAIVLFRPKEYLLSKYLYYFLCEGSEIFNYSSEYKGSAGQTNISLTQCRNFSIPIPSIDEQKEIINQVDILFSLASTIEEKFLILKENIEQLPQSILSKTFKGELVPQDPDDEPAKKLLERIMGEKRHLQKTKE